MQNFALMVSVFIFFSNKNFGEEIYSPCKVSNPGACQDHVVCPSDDDLCRRESPQDNHSVQPENPCPKEFFVCPYPQQETKKNDRDILQCIKDANVPCFLDSLILDHSKNLNNDAQRFNRSWSVVDDFKSTICIGQNANFGGFSAANEICFEEGKAKQCWSISGQVGLIGSSMSHCIDGSQSLCASLGFSGSSIGLCLSQEGGGFGVFGQGCFSNSSSGALGSSISGCVTTPTIGIFTRKKPR